MSNAATPRYALGVDYGTNSVRALVVNCANGAEVGAHVFNYPSGDAGILLDHQDPNLARQRPQDYIDGFFEATVGALKAAKQDPDFALDRVVGIGVDTTGSTPIPVDGNGVALGCKPEFKNELAAMAWLWKDHTGFAEAAEITEKARAQKRPYMAKIGGVYSSEWFWSKILHCARTAPKVFEAAHSWVECQDFIPGFLTGNSAPSRIARGVCAAGHKAMYSDEWGGLPSAEFLATLDPRLADLRGRLYERAVPADHKAGDLAPDVAAKLGLPAGIPVAVGAMDAHMGAVGSGVKAGRLVKIIGTSSCDMMVGPADGSVKDIPGICGIVNGSIIPGMLGIEAGQSAVGDLFNWFVTHLCPEPYSKGDAHANLNAAAANLKPGESGLVALDWNNGNRTVLVDPLLTGLLVGQTLHTSAPEVYRALIEATAYGALAIVSRIEEYGVRVDEVVTGGGIAEKSPLTMQIYADVLNRPIKLSRSSQTCALGSAIFGSVVGGAHRTVADAVDAMTGVKELVYTPNPASVAVYARLYAIYRALHDAFGTKGFSGALDRVMKDLIAIRDDARNGATE